MPTKDELRAEIASLREELAAERAKVEVLREQAPHGCHCSHAVASYWCATCLGMRYPGHSCTYTLTWPTPNSTVTPYVTTSTSGSGGAGCGALS